MSTHELRCALAALVLLLGGCSDPSQTFVPFEVQAVVDQAPFVRADGGVIAVEEGSFGLGPFVFCASSTASPELCETAVAELRTAHAVDVAAAEPVRLGQGQGLTGTIRSAGFDYGQSWLLTEERLTPDGNIVDGHAALLSGTFTRDGATVPFSATIDCLPQLQGARAVTTAPATGTLTDAATALDVHVRPAAWLEGVDFDAALEAAVPLVLAPDSLDHDAVVLAMKSRFVPTFDWRNP